MTALMTRPAPAAPVAVARHRWLAILTGGWLLFLAFNVALSGRWWLWLVPDLVPPIVLPLVSLVLAGLVLVLRADRWTLVVVLAGLALAVVQGGFNVAALGPAPGAVAGTRIRIVSWNTEVWDQWDDPGRFYALLRAQDADVYLLQEYQPYDDPATQAADQDRLRAAFPGYTAVERGELLTLTRLPLLRTFALPAEPPPGASWLDTYSTVKSLRTDLRVGGTTVSVYNVHMPVQVDLALTSHVLSRIEQRDAARHVQYAALERDLRGNSGPEIVAGDFNTSPVMGDIRPLTRLLHDAASANRSFYPASWRTYWRIPLWRLDWAFTSTGVHVDKYALRSAHGMSDHEMQQLTVTVGRSS